MRRVAATTLSVCLILLASLAHAQSGDTTAVEEPALRRELLEMEQLDQEVRQFQFDPEQEADSATVARMASVDSSHTERLKEIVRRYGWPDYELVGKDGADAAFLLVQHSPDREFKRRMLPLLRKAYERGEAEGQSLALLTDRVRIGEGKPQLYGSQYNIEDVRVVFVEIEDREHVDERRSEMGMPPLDTYRKMVEELSGIEDHGLFDDNE